MKRTPKCVDGARLWCWLGLVALVGCGGSEATQTLGASDDLEEMGRYVVPADATLEIVPRPVSADAYFTIRPSAAQTFSAVYMEGTSMNAATYLSGVSLNATNGALMAVPEARWYVIQPEGGTIDLGGSYRAPAAPGTFHVFASVPDDAKKRALVEVKVTVAGAPSLTISPSIVSMGPNARVRLTAEVFANGIDTSLTWSVVGGEQNGRVDSAGNYQAPSKPGVYVVRAKMVHASSYALATIIVE